MHLAGQSKNATRRMQLSSSTRIVCVRLNVDSAPPQPSDKDDNNIDTTSASIICVFRYMLKIHVPEGQRKEIGRGANTNPPPHPTRPRRRDMALHGRHIISARAQRNKINSSARFLFG